MKDKRFNIFGTTYKLKFVDKIESDDNDTFIWGNTDSRIHEIRIATRDINNKLISDDELGITLLHELFHAILNEGQYSGYSSDEPLIEWMARSVHSLKKQGII